MGTPHAANEEPLSPPPTTTTTANGTITRGRSANKGDELISTSSQDNLSFRDRLGRRMGVDVDTKWADIPLLLCFFISGLVDGAAFNVWSCFVSMQTGNTIFVGLGVSNQPTSAAPYGWSKSLTAIVCFLLGAFAFSRFHTLISPIRRWVLIASFSFQTLLIIIAAVLATTDTVSNRDTIIKTETAATDSRTTGDSNIQLTFSSQVNWIDLASLACLAFQSAGQVVASRMLKYNELPTVVLTSLYCDLMSDPQLLTAGLFEDPKRNRRVMGAVMLLTGAISGGFLSKSWVGIAGVLWIVAALKVGIVLAWFLWKPKMVIKERGVESG